MTKSSAIVGLLGAVQLVTGPNLGNTRAGFIAERFGPARSIVIGGLVCVVGVLACLPLLPAFWRYRKSESGAAA